MVHETNRPLDLNRDSNRLFGAGFAGGVIGAIAITIILAILRGLGITQLNFELILGSFITHDTGPGSWWLGFIWNCINGGIFGLIYAAAFRGATRTGAGIGVGFGVIHWIAAGIFMGIAQHWHPLMPAQMTAPGWFAANLGWSGIIFLCLVHLVFGGVVGGVHRGTADRLVLQRTGGPKSEDERPRHIA